MQEINEHTCGGDTTDLAGHQHCLASILTDDHEQNISGYYEYWGIYLFQHQVHREMVLEECD